MLTDKQKTACFTGHRILSKKDIEKILVNLNNEIDRLIGQGVTNFISGGAIGFDQIAASLIIAKKQQNSKLGLKLIFILPCKNQDERWNDRQKNLYQSLLKEADEIYYVSDVYTSECLRERNKGMVDKSAYCICAMTSKISGTAQTVNYAIDKNLKVTNILES
jgi:uncharacterized phage-like protein YoqJ